MLLYGLIFLIGLGVLYLGAEWLIRGAASLALRYGIRPLVVGITVVALGTSMPEFVVNFFAALSGEDSLALGNIVGSNIANIALILGTSALVLPLSVTRGTLRKEYPMMMAAMVLFYLLALDGVIDKWDGLTLVLGLIAFFVFLVFDARRHSIKVGPKEAADVHDDDVVMPPWRKVGILVGGVVALAVGARLMVYSAVEVANVLGIDSVIIGLTIVAIGTSLPELAASVVSAMKQEADLSIGNVLGSNLLNVLFVVGLVSLISPLKVDTTALAVHFPVMLGFGVLFLPLAWTGFKINRFEGSVLLIAFVGYLFYISLPYM